MTDSQRKGYPTELIIHHSVTDLLRDVDDINVQDLFSSIGKERGYKYTDANGKTQYYIPYHEHPSKAGQYTYAMAHFCLHPYTKD